MATVLDMIKRAHRIAGVYTIGETPSSEECADTLAALNSMLGSWANESLLIYAETLDSITLTAGLATYTIGATGTTVSARPVSICDSTYIEIDSIDYPLTVITLDEFNSIPAKAQESSIPEFLWYRPTFPNGTITLYPVPSSASTLKLWSRKPITAFTAITDTVSLPPGYQDTIEYNLAEAVAIENEVQLQPAAAKKAVMLKKLLKRANLVVPRMIVPGAVSNQKSNIYSG